MNGETFPKIKIQHTQTTPYLYAGAMHHVTHSGSNCNFLSPVHLLPLMSEETLDSQVILFSLVLHTLMFPVLVHELNTYE
jgi:hypothetical protein